MWRLKVPRSALLDKQPSGTSVSANNANVERELLLTSLQSALVDWPGPMKVQVRVIGSEVIGTTFQTTQTLC